MHGSFQVAWWQRIHLQRNEEMQETQGPPLSQKDLLEKEMQPTPEFLPGKISWTEEPTGCSPWGCKESDSMSYWARKLTQDAWALPRPLITSPLPLLTLLPELRLPLPAPCLWIWKLCLEHELGEAGSTEPDSTLSHFKSWLFLRPQAQERNSERKFKKITRLIAGVQPPLTWAVSWNQFARLSTVSAHELHFTLEKPFSTQTHTHRDIHTHADRMQAEFQSYIAWKDLFTLAIIPVVLTSPAPCLVKRS